VKHITKNRVHVSIYYMDLRCGSQLGGVEPRGVGGVSPSSLVKGLGRGLCLLGPSPEIFSYFLLKIPYFCTF